MSNQDKPFTLAQWAEVQPEAFDLTAEFHARIQPLVDALMNECKALGMPALVNITYAQTAVDTSGAMASIMPGDARTPPSLLLMKCAGRLDADGMDAVLAAIACRMRGLVVPSNTTKH